MNKKYQHSVDVKFDTNIVSWLHENIGVFDYNIDFVNGRLFRDRIYFKHEKDAIAFKLRFRQ